jgi:hypothetical protein
MKISTTWTQRDWQDTLKKVWKLSNGFEEILTFLLERGYITSSDIIKAGDIYKDPYKTYSDEEIEEIIKDVPLSDLMGMIQHQYNTDDIIEYMDKEDILDTIGDDELLYHIENSVVMDEHDDEVKEQVYREYIDEWIEEFNTSHKNFIDELRDSNPDDLHEHICEIANCGYYDQESINKIKDKLNKNTFGIKY